MALVDQKQRRELYPHRREMVRLLEEIDRRSGIPVQSTLTVDELHESLIRHGVRPEDNIGSRELLHMRYGEDAEQE